MAEALTDCWVDSGGLGAVDDTGGDHRSRERMELQSYGPPGGGDCRRDG